MKNFILGAISAVAVFGLGGLAFALLGLINTDADQVPSKAEAWLANSAMDASMQRHAAHINSPVQATDANLIDGMKTYVMACAECHGGLDKKPAPFAKQLYPPAPQLILDPPEDQEWHIFYAIKHGVRNTGMPAWNGAFTDEDLWKITAFLSHVDKLPPAVQEQWKKSLGQ